jgi:hypothetical protein
LVSAEFVESYRMGNIPQKLSRQERWSAYLAGEGRFLLSCLLAEFPAWGQGGEQQTAKYVAGQIASLYIYSSQSAHSAPNVMKLTLDESKGKNGTASMSMIYLETQAVATSASTCIAKHIGFEVKLGTNFL